MCQEWINMGVHKTNAGDGICGQTYIRMFKNYRPLPYWQVVQTLDETKTIELELSTRVRYHPELVK